MKHQSIILENNQLGVEEILKTIEDRKGIQINRFLVNVIESDKASIGIGDLSELASWAYLKNEDGIKAAVVNNAEIMTMEAQNSILKILEEPPENTLIILSTSNSDSLLETIASRCEKIKIIDEKLKIKEIESSIEDLFSSDFLQRQIILTRFTDSREELLKFLEEIIRYSVKHDLESKFINFIEYSIEAVGRNVSVKVILNNINLELETLDISC